LKKELNSSLSLFFFHGRGACHEKNNSLNILKLFFQGFFPVTLSDPDFGESDREDFSLIYLYSLFLCGISSILTGAYWHSFTFTNPQSLLSCARTQQPKFLHLSTTKLIKAAG
jgi:hypothetical protein